MSFNCWFMFPHSEEILKSMTVVFLYSYIVFTLICLSFSLLNYWFSLLSLCFLTLKLVTETQMCFIFIKYPWNNKVLSLCLEFMRHIVILQELTYLWRKYIHCLYANQLQVWWCAYFLLYSSCLRHRLMQ